MVNYKDRGFSTRYARVDFTKGQKLLRNMGQIANEEMRNTMEEMAQIGAERMKDSILSSATDFSLRAQREGLNRGPGRFRTGQMYRDVMWRAEVGPKRFYAAFGWIKRVQDYYRYQETGFRNRFFWRSPLKSNRPTMRANGAYKMTEGMFALWDARQHIRDIQGKMSRKMAERIKRRLQSSGGK